MAARKTIGLLGCGLWGRKILDDLCALDCRVIVIDPNPARRQEALAAGAASALAEFDDLPPVDGIIVATPATTHGTVLEAVLARPVPVYCEKPLTTDPASAQRLANRAADRLFVMHVWRYHHGVERLAVLARDRVLGPVELLRTTRTNWTSPRRDIDGIWTLAPHDLSIALEILGRIPTPRWALAERLGEAAVGLFGILGDDVPFVFEVSTRYAEKRREVRLHCRDGVAVLSGGEAGYVEIVRHAHGSPDVERVALPNEPPLRRELEAFLAHLDGGAPPRTSAAEAARIVAVLAQLRQLAGIDLPPRGPSA